MSPRRQTLKKPIKKPSIASSILSSTGQMIARHPSIVGGGTAFIIIFSFIASNALYYQKGAHPAPILNMRGPQFIISGSTKPVENVRTARSTNPNIKTFRVQHSDDIQTSSVRVPVPATALNENGRALEAIITQQTPPSLAKGDELVRKVQKELAAQSLYLDVVDGLTGPNTRKAVMAAQEKFGMTTDGTITDGLLKRLKKANAPKQMAKLETKKPQKTSVSNDMVRLIQIGLAQSAYPHIDVDGFAGQQTRDAIAQFEKHYRLPVTGLPNQQVLDKLESIGAF